MGANRPVEGIRAGLEGCQNRDSTAAETKGRKKGRSESREQEEMEAGDVATHSHCRVGSSLAVIGLNR
jgi:hypothetical protein